jgi:surface protein
MRRILFSITALMGILATVFVPVQAGARPVEPTEPAEVAAAESPAGTDIFCGFVDVPYQSYYSESSCWLKEKAITNGVSLTEYGPFWTVTRAQTAAFLWRSAGFPSAVSSCGFTDQAQIPTWARQGACWLKAKGGLNNNTTYRPFDNMTRAEMALMLWGANNKPASTSSCGFTDQAQIPTWARQGACWLKARNITNNNPYRPLANVTRAEMSAFLWRNAGRPSVTADTLSNTNGTAAVLWYRIEPQYLSDDPPSPARLPVLDATVTVDWGDGTSENLTIGSSNVYHQYAEPGYYRVKITGTAQHFAADWISRYQAFPDLKAVSSFGDLGITSVALTGSSNLQRVPTKLPATVTDLSDAFNSAADNGRLNDPALIGWDTSNVTNMRYMFSSVGAFNQPIGNWNTANVTDMGFMFSSALTFNQPLNNWNTAKVTNMDAMFIRALTFNQPLNNWNTANVTNMAGVFSSASAFNQPIGNWNTANVTDMSRMFNGATSFNQPIGNWNTTKVTDMKFMFNGARAFNQNISRWNVTNVTDWDNFRASSALTTANTPPKFR